MCVDTGNRIITEGEYVEMTGITKDMSGSYDCITSNDISPPDVRTVQVTVNCEYLIHSKQIPVDAIQHAFMNSSITRDSFHRPTRHFTSSEHRNGCRTERSFVV